MVGRGIRIWRGISPSRMTQSLWSIPHTDQSIAQSPKVALLLLKPARMQRWRVSVPYTGEPLDDVEDDTTSSIADNAA